jgi:hypothetical protein
VYTLMNRPVTPLTVKRNKPNLKSPELSLLVILYLYSHLHLCCHINCRRCVLAHSCTEVLQEGGNSQNIQVQCFLAQLKGP